MEKNEKEVSLRAREDHQEVEMKERQNEESCVWKIRLILVQIGNLFLLWGK
jgi:hypothetical protein